MISKGLLIKNPSGLHARPATQLSDLCQGFKSELIIEFDDIVIEPRSVLSILCAGIHPGSTVTLIADGDDEQIAVDEITKLIISFKE